MPDLDPILDTLWHDVQMLGNAIVDLGVFWLIPAAVIGFIAAAKTEPTRWRDLPVGIFWGWLGGVPSGIAALLVLAGMLEITELGRWRYSEFLWGGVLIAGGIVAIVTNYRSSVRYYRWKIQQLYGWKIDDPPLRPANHLYSFTLRRLLIVQFVAIFVFAMWVGARREMILQAYEYQREEAYKQNLQTRFGDFGWHGYRFGQEGLWLRMRGRSLVNFQDQVLERLEPADRLTQMEIRSDALTDRGLEILSRNAALSELRMQSQQVTDAGIVHLKKLKSLRRVELACPQLTEESLDSLQGIESLQYVTLYHSKITPERALEFKEKRPGVSFHNYSFGP
jgi:hypothetical protein